VNTTNSDGFEAKMFWTNFFRTFFKCVHKICNLYRIVGPYCCNIFLGPDIIIVDVFFFFNLTSSGV